MDSVNRSNSSISQVSLQQSLIEFHTRNAQLYLVFFFLLIEFDHYSDFGHLIPYCLLNITDD